MKKNGFTLVELLAAIVILGILMTIATTAFSNMLGNATDSGYKDFESSIKNAAINYFVDHTSNLPKVGSEVAISAKTLIRDGYLVSMKDPQTGGKALTCDQNSYIVIKQATSVNGYNLNLTYSPCIVCSSYKSSTCKATRPSPML